MKVEGLFPTPVYCNTINNPDVTKELDECYSSIDFRYYDKFKETHKLSPDPFDNNVITHYNLENFWKELDFNVNQYCTNVFNIEDYRYKITNSWFSQFDKGDYGHTHNHGSSDLSGVYYCKQMVRTVIYFLNVRLKVCIHHIFFINIFVVGNMNQQ